MVAPPSRSGLRSCSYSFCKQKNIFCCLELGQRRLEGQPEHGHVHPCRAAAEPRIAGVEAWHSALCSTTAAEGVPICWLQVQHAVSKRQGAECKGARGAHRREAPLLPAADDGHDLVIAVAPHAEAVECAAQEGNNVGNARRRMRRAAAPCERRAAAEPRGAGALRQPPTRPAPGSLCMRTTCKHCKWRFRNGGSPQGLRRPPCTEHRCLGAVADAACRCELHGCLCAWKWRV